ncbi:Dolichyl-phosphate-mannose-protein mannosyltransferase [Nitrosovibrio sp. Nv17]|nr:Dolichyl-phosphate-mannose-protein mannosyltransferase [Nitrosovibrio sp. Nv17]
MLPVPENSLGRKSGSAAAPFRVLDSPYFIPLCFILFIGLRAALIFAVPLEMDSDSRWYLNRALGIANGEGYVEDGHPTAYWPVGYPGFLGILFHLAGPHQIVGQLANLLMAAGIFLLQLKLTRQLFRSETTARLGVLLLALYPNNIAYTPLLLTEIYFTFLLLLGVYLYISRNGWGWVFGSGLVFGFAALTKPQIVFLPALLILFRIVAAGRETSLAETVVKGCCIYLVMAGVLVPWAVRNTLVFGEVVLISTNGGATLLTGNNPSADGSYIENDPLVLQRDFSTRRQVESDRRAKQLALAWIRENPGRFVELIPLKMWHLWAKDGEAEWAYQAGYPHYPRHQSLFRSIRWANQVLYALMLVGSLVTLVLLSRGKHDVAWPWVSIGYCLMAYLTLISVVFSGQSRFHFPAMPWIIMYAAWAAVVLGMRLSRRGD